VDDTIDAAASSPFITFVVSSCCFFLLQHRREAFQPCGDFWEYFRQIEAFCSGKRSDPGNDEMIGDVNKTRLFCVK